MEEITNLLHMPVIQLGGITIDFARILAVLLVCLVALVIIAWTAGFIRRSMIKRAVNPNIVQLVSRAYQVLSLVVLSLITLELLNVPLTAFAFISGAVAIGVGFGAQNIINNFISGWILMWERPIKIGDFLEIGEARGTVEAINTRSTRICRIDGVHMLVPNSHLLENTVVNWTLLDSLVRTSVRVGVAYGSDVRLTERLLSQAAAEHPDVLKSPSSSVIFEDFGSSALIFDLNIWIHARAERGLRGVRSDLRFRIEELFRENKVSIAFPQQDVHIDGELRLRQD
ncbi:mechanosensitive ion channel [Parahaliea sp. F7430]|uniref:Mechanosensitive ion channel n=1 Tax=Sediminihaliea albiluteola TaxID=2758564 RepID=A0A7W2YJM8_9GAMM|nr:mechanosensitive ion channel domain-containing protein [Sediminihaliea albiluteola]MBA6412473.1 mechanosensitive ion channel [Sediminihaliea albiluteola]